MRALEERTLNFAKETLNTCQQIPKSTINSELIRQLTRSSGSVGANYREANDAVSKKDFIHRMRITRKECKETSYWLELLSNSNSNYKESFDNLIIESKELRRIFSAIIDKSSL